MFKKDAIQKGKFAETSNQLIKEMKKIDSWYVAIRSTPETKSKGLPTALDWITSITVQCLKSNSNFRPDNMVS